MKQAYMCSYCDEIMAKDDCIEHEKICYWNPNNKHCYSCMHRGVVKYPDSDRFGVSFINSTQGCMAGYITPNADTIFNCEFYKEDSGK